MPTRFVRFITIKDDEIIGAFAVLPLSAAFIVLTIGLRYSRGYPKHQRSYASALFPAAAPAASLAKHGRIPDGVVIAMALPPASAVGRNAMDFVNPAPQNLSVEKRRTWNQPRTSRDHESVHEGSGCP